MKIYHEKSQYQSDRLDGVASKPQPLNVQIFLEFCNHDIDLHNIGGPICTHSCRLITFGLSKPDDVQNAQIWRTSDAVVLLRWSRPFELVLWPNANLSNEHSKSLKLYVWLISATTNEVSSIVYTSFMGRFEIVVY